MDKACLRSLENCIAGLEGTYGQAHPGKIAVWQQPSLEALVRLIDYLVVELESLDERKLSRDLRECFVKLMDTLNVSQDSLYPRHTMVMH